MVQHMCSRPGCKQESAIGEVTAHIENIKDDQRRLEVLIERTNKLVVDLERHHASDEENNKVVLTKVCSFIQTQNTQLKDLVKKYEHLRICLDQLDKDSDVFKIITDSLGKHDKEESIIIKDIKECVDILEKTKIDPLDKWKTQVMTLVVVLPVLLTLIINVLVFHDKILKMLSN